MSHISTYSIAHLSPMIRDRLAQIQANSMNLQAQIQANAAARKRAEEIVLSELSRNFMELAQRQEDAAGNLRLLLKVNPQSAPGKTGDVEILIKSDNTLSIDVSNAPGQVCKELTQPLEMALGTPISVHYKPEYHDGKVRLMDSQQNWG
ncbi:DUF2997 domain-containing protein [Limnofasciculus baicalensis]|uniref:DUF2997 domain-containing protein n=1 Tax=Limnofasciculus baicalensis BBK-W-15 TaxID=2699891 RepID=A0AAE3GQU1_9CYAN|nr:DUF2997 domain-containing protein [Limnofasciculus baicalensis]MCP2729026.1 DUF2997 domain-containing protein [Limnofasciculus baicalensis BBK-W-15]